MATLFYIKDPKSASMPHRLLVGASQGDVSLDVLPELRDVFPNLTDLIID